MGIAASHAPCRPCGKQVAPCNAHSLGGSPRPCPLWPVLFAPPPWPVRSLSAGACLGRGYGAEPDRQSLLRTPLGARGGDPASRPDRSCRPGRGRAPAWTAPRRSSALPCPGDRPPAGCRGWPALPPPSDTGLGAHRSRATTVRGRTPGLEGDALACPVKPIGAAPRRGPRVSPGPRPCPAILMRRLPRQRPRRPWIRRTR